MTQMIYSEIDIDAPAEVVWRVLTAFRYYPAWNPFIRSVQGEPRPGNELRVQVQSTQNKSMVFNPLLVSIKPNREMIWTGHVLFPGLFDGDHMFRIIPVSAQRVRFLHSERFSGLFSAIILKMIGDATERGFAEMNRALKSVAESCFQSSIGHGDLQ